MFYKDPVQLIDKTDKSYKGVTSLFTYKTALIRTHEHSKMIMEIYMPILLTKAKEKTAKFQPGSDYMKAKSLTNSTGI